MMECTPRKRGYQTSTSFLYIFGVMIVKVIEFGLLGPRTTNTIGKLKAFYQSIFYFLSCRNAILHMSFQVGHNQCTYDTWHNLRESL